MRLSWCFLISLDPKSYVAWKIVRQLVYTGLLLIITFRFTCDERKICLTFKKSQNIMNMIVVSSWKMIQIFKHDTILTQLGRSIKKLPTAKDDSFLESIFDLNPTCQMRLTCLLATRLLNSSWSHEKCQKIKTWRGLGQFLSKHWSLPTLLCKILWEN